MTKKCFSFLGLCVVVAGVGFVVNNCSSDTTSSVENLLSRAMGLVAVTSPTATSSRRSMSPKGNVLFSGVEDVKPMNEMVQQMGEFVNNANPDQAAATIGNPADVQKATDASCYGPTIIDNARGTGQNTPRPPGDLGMFFDTGNATDTKACAAAQMNALMGGTPQYVNKWIAAQGLMLAALNKAGTELPAIGASVNAASVMPDFEGITISTATLSRLANDAAGKEVYKTVISFTTVVGSDTGTVTIYHTPLNADNTDFKGLFQAVLPHTPSTGGQGGTDYYRGISMLYEQASSVMTLSMRMAANRAVSSNNFFGATAGVVDFSKTSFGEDGQYLNATFNTSTNSAIAHFAWQAGEQDGAVRTFSIKAQIGTDETGVAYFGFGPDMDTLTGAGVPWMNGMFCDWLQGLANGTKELKVQKQTFDLTAFAPVTSLIDFAPNSRCKCDGVGGVCNSTYDVTATGSFAFLNGTKTVATHELVTPPTASDIAVVSEPVFVVPTR